MAIVMCDILYRNELENATPVEHTVGYMLKGKGKHLSLYWWLRKFDNKKDGYAYPIIQHNKKDNPNPKTDDLVTLLGYSKPTIIKLIRDLEDMQLLKVIKVSTGSGARVKNRYVVYQPFYIEDKHYQYVYDENIMLKIDNEEVLDTIKKSLEGSSSKDFSSN